MWNEAVFKENKMLRMKVLVKKAFQDSVLVSKKQGQSSN